MANDSKMFPPSDHKLKKLRSDGIIPWSREWQLAVSFLGFGIGLLCLSFGFHRLSLALKELFSGKLGAIAAAEQAFENLFSLSGYALFPLLLVCLLGGAFQTSFLITSKTFSQRKRYRFTRVPSSRLSAALWSLFSAAALVLLAYLLLRGAFQDFSLTAKEPIPPLRSLSIWESSNVPDTQLFSRSRVQDELTGEAFWIFFVLLGFLSVLAALSRFVALLAYRAEHGMTREEAEAENRELEMSPDTRRRISEAQEE